MTIRSKRLRTAISTTACTAAIWYAAPALAQSGDSDTDLGEVIVTATRQADTVSRVPLSITAVTSQMMEEQGVRGMQDLARTVPSVTMRGSGTGDTSIAIRGVISGIGAATVGVYLDDTPIQKRLANGVTSGNGNAYPQLFDLDRVEVLRGPQGTLYGGSSEGGTVRFITPAPSLTEWSGRVRGELGSTDGGSGSYEAGAALGGPLIENRLGIRASVWARHAGGYLDHVSIYDRTQFGNNTNTTDIGQFRVAMLWEPMENLQITPAIYGSSEKTADNDTFWEDVPQFFVKSGTFNNGPASLAPGLGALFPSFPNTAFTGGTYGPYDQFGPFKTPIGYYPTTESPQLQTSPRTTTLFIPSLTINYRAGSVDIRSITSFVNDINKGWNSSGGFGLRSALLPTSITGTCGQGQPVLNTTAGCAPLTFDGFPQKTSQFFYRNARDGVTQELRFTSAPDARPFTWVGGLFWSHSKFTVKSDEYSTEEAATLFLRGVEEQYFLGNISNCEVRIRGGCVIADRFIEMKETEVAAFGEANYFFTDNLRLIAGVRFSRNKLDYYQATQGVIFARPFDFVPTAAQPFPADPRLITEGSVSESPVTPKLGLSWQVNERNLLYATAARGYRAGGVNVPANPTQCAAGIAELGGVPPSVGYASDSVTSYEVGAKSRVLGNLQINTSLFQVDWKDPQIARAFATCGYSYVDNAGAAVSRGVELESQLRLFTSLTLSAALSYTDAHYTETIRSPGAALATVQAGDELGVPAWAGSVSANYAFRVLDRYSAYIRGDFRYNGTYQRGAAQGSTGHDPLTARGGATRFATARAGLQIDNWDVSLFVNNLTNSRDRINVGHSAFTALMTSSTFRPREVGVAASLSFR